MAVIDAVPILRSAGVRLAVAVWCLAVGTLATGALTGCGLRRMPPVRYVPLLGAPKKVTTAAVLRSALHDRDPAIRGQAVQVLGLLAQGPDHAAQREAAQVLGTAALDPDPGVRVLAVEQLGRLPPELANKHLLRALRDASPFVRQRVLLMLRRQLTPAVTEPATAAADPEVPPED